MKSPTTTSSSLKNLSLPESGEPYFDGDAPENLDIDQFTKTLSNIKSKTVRPDLLASIISHYASKWLPELTSDRPVSVSVSVSSPGSSTAAWLKKRFLIENVIAILPREKDSMPCEFLLRLLRAASMVGVGPDQLANLEDQVAYQLDRASLKEVMIPAFSHTCGTLLDVSLVIRLIERFLAMEEARSGAAMVKVAKLVDSYLAEVAMDAGLTVAEFERLATTMPGHARAADDGLYRAVDTYVKVSF